MRCLSHWSTFGTPWQSDQGGGQGGPHLTVSRRPTCLSVSTFPHAYQKMSANEKPTRQCAVPARNGAPEDFGSPRRSMSRPRYCCAVDARLPAASMCRVRHVQLLKVSRFNSVGPWRGPIRRRRLLVVLNARERKHSRQNGRRIHV